MNPYAVEALQALGIDTAAHQSKPVADIDSATMDRVITLGAEKVCLTFLGQAERPHEPIPDPASEGPRARAEDVSAQFCTA